MKRQSLRRSKKLFLAILLFSSLYAVVFGATFSNLPGRVLASASTEVAVDPANSTAEPNEYFTVNVTITNVTNLYFWGAKISWPAGLLGAHDDNVTEGDFLKKGGSTSFVGKAYLDHIDMSSTILGAGSASGNGTLATITFKVLDSGNCTLEFSNTIFRDDLWVEIIPSIQDGYFYTNQPVAKFIYTPHPRESYGRPIVDETVTFNATQSFDPDGGSIDSYEWDFGDSTTASGNITTHVYDEPGSYPVTLNVTDEEGKEDFTNRDMYGNPLVKIQLHDIAVINVTVTPTTFSPGASLTINVTVLNKGSVDDSLNVTVYQNVNPVNTTVFRFYQADRWKTTLVSGDNATTPVMWDTTGVYPGDYTLGVYIFLVHRNETTRVWESVAELERDEVLPDNWMLFQGSIRATGEKVHDMAITNLDVSPTDLEIDVEDLKYSNVEATIKNEGNVNEHYNATITITYGSETVGLKSWSNQTLSAGTTAKLEFKYWLTGTNTTNEGEYNVTVSIVIINATTLDFLEPYNASVPDDDPTDNMQSVLIDINLFPEPYFTYSPSAPRVNELVTFNASASYSPGTPGGTIITYMWNFGDGTKVTGTSPVVTHVFRWNGAFTVMLKVTDDVSLTSNTTKSLSVSPFGNIAITNVAFSPHMATMGELISINVTVNARLFQENFNVTTYFNDNEIGTQSDITLQVGNTITLTFTWGTAGVPEGNYTIKAVASSPTPPKKTTFIGGTITVKKLQSTLTLTVFPSEFTVGATTTMNGTLSPAQTGVNVVILYKQNSEETWSILANVTTVDGGIYSHEWSPEKAGTYTIKSSWLGDDVRMPDESEVLVVTVHEVAQLSVFLYTTVALAVAIVGIVFYFVRVRKPK